MDRTITVTGSGKSSVSPDTINIYIHLLTRNADYTKTMVEAARQREAVGESLAPLGFEKTDIKTKNFIVNTDYEDVQDSHGVYSRVFRGYLCRHDLKIKLGMSMQTLSGIMIALASCAAKPEFSVEFTVREREAKKNAVLAAAAKNAREKALVLCSASGVQLGEIVHIEYGAEETGSSPAPYRIRNIAACADGADVELCPGEITFYQSVTVTYAIL